MFDRFKSSLTTRQAVVTILVAVSLSLFTSAVRLAVDVADERERALNSLARNVNLVDDSAAKAAYELDYVLAQKVVDGLLASPFARRATLYNDFNELLAVAVADRSPQWTDGMARLAYGRDPMITYNLYSQAQGQPVGRLEVELNRGALFDEFVGRSARAASMGLARDCLLALVLALFFHRSIIRPVLGMARQVSGVNPSDPEPGTVLPPQGHETDELGALAGTVNRLIEGLGASLEQARRIQSELDKRQAFLQALMDNVPDAVLAVGPGGLVEHANPMVRDVLGFEPGDLVGQSVSDALGLPLPSTDTKDIHQRHVTYARNGKPRELDVCISRAEIQGTLFGVYLIRDVTEQRQFERALAESEDIFRNMVEQATDALYIVDTSGAVVQVNRKACDMLGYRREELIGKDITAVDETLDPDDIPRIQAVVRQEGMLTRNGEHVRKDGSRLQVEERIGRFDRRGEELLIAQVSDVSERLAFEQALKSALEQAEAASLAKSEFLANMSHEVRTPLNGAMGMLHILLRTDLTENQRHFVETALKSCRNLVRLLSDILDLSKVEAGRLEIIAEPVNVPEIVRSAADNFADIARDKGLNLDCRVDPAIPTDLQGDPVRLRQVLFNLAGNAVKYTEQGCVRVEAWSLPPTAGGLARILFEVTDTGMGIPDDKLEEMFEAFTQLDTSFGRRYQGAGLGLRIVKRLVELMGGTLAVDSSPGTGTSIFFSLALTRVEEKPAATAPRPTAVPAGNIRALVVEDEAISRMAVQMLLKQSGMEAQTAANGEQALEILAEESFDVVLMDVQMPVMDGVEATSRIRDSKGPGSSVPIIALTAYAMKGDRERFIGAGMDGYVVKPIEDQALMAEINRVLAARRA